MKNRGFNHRIGTQTINDQPMATLLEIDKVSKVLKIAKKVKDLNEVLNWKSLRVS